MTATDTIRAMLDERGVEYRTHGMTDRTWFDVGDISWFVIERENGGTAAVEAVFPTPEQAIEATLGRGECHVESVQQDCNMTRYGWVCDRCHGLTIGFAAPHFCSVCGRKVRA